MDCSMPMDRLPCPSPTPGVYSNSCPSSQWCHPTISSSIIPFFSHRQSFPASGTFPMSQFFASDGHSIGVSASASVFPRNIQDWFPFRMNWLDLLAVQKTLKSLLQHHVEEFSKTSIQHSAFFIVQLSHPYMTTGKGIALTRWTLVGKGILYLFSFLWTNSSFSEDLKKKKKTVRRTERNRIQTSPTGIVAQQS